MKLILDDCLNALKSIPDNSIDSIITDPPYGMDYQSCWNKKNKKPKILNDKKPFIWFLFDGFRILKDGGSLLCFSDWKNQESWKNAIEIAGFTIRSHVIWDREVHGMGDLNGSFGPQHDIIWFATKGKFKFTNGRPKDVIRSKRIQGVDLKHPTEKPVDLMKQLVLSITPKNGRIIDPFMGCGSTGVAAKECGFEFIGIEKEKEYFDIASRRLA